MACFCPSLIPASVDPSVSGPVLCPGSVSGFYRHLCSPCPTILEIFLYLKLEERLFKVNLCWMSEIQALKEMQQKRCQRGNSPVSSFFSGAGGTWEPALGVCFAWSLSILWITCPVAFCYCPLCLRSTTLASSDGHVSVFLTFCGRSAPHVPQAPLPSWPSLEDQCWKGLGGLSCTFTLLAEELGWTGSIFSSCPTPFLCSRNSSQSEACACRFQ